MNQIAKALIKEVKKNISKKKGSRYLLINPVGESGKHEDAYDNLLKLRDLLDEFIE